MPEEPSYIDGRAQLYPWKSAFILPEERGYIFAMKIVVHICFCEINVVNSYIIPKGFNFPDMRKFGPENLLA